MSNNYYFKIKKLEVTSISIEKIGELSLHAMQDNFRSLLKGFELDLKKEPSKIKIPRLLELLKIVRDTQGVEALKKVKCFPWHRNEEWIKLRESYTNGINLFHDYGAILGNNLFHTVVEDKEKILPVLMVNIEIISVHPDAGFPRFRSNALITKLDERNFLLRILGDAFYHINRDHLLVKESRKTIHWDKNKVGTDYKMDASKIIWGFERHKGLKMKLPSNKSFWKKYDDQWWSDLKDSDLYYPSDNKPFELIKYDVMIHPGWEKELTQLLDKRIDSTAHWS